MEKQYILNARGGLKHSLERIGRKGSKKYKLICQLNVRVGIIEDDPDSYSFIDPSGGPFITPGFEVDGHKVKSIRKGEEGFIVEFE